MRRWVLIEPNMAVPDGRVVIVAIVIGASLLIGFAVVATLGDVGDDVVSQDDQDDVVLLNGNQFVLINADDGTGTNEEVRDSRGHALELTGADDSFVQSQSDFTVAEDDSWTICTWASVDAEGGAENETMTAVSIDGDVLLNYNGTDGNWSGWFYDRGSRDSYVVNASATDQPGTLTPLCLVHNGSHVSIYRNNSLGETENASVESIESVETNTTNWDGRLDETRFDDDALNASQRQQLIDDPIGPLTTSNRTGRMMYDEGSGTLVYIFWASTNADSSNASYVDGLDGSVLDRDTMLSPGDYEWRSDGPEIKPVEGGELDGAPVAYVAYDFHGQLDALERRIGDAFIVGGVILVVLFGGAAISILRAT